MNSIENSSNCVICGSAIAIKIESWVYKCEKCQLFKSLLFKDKFNGNQPIGWTDDACLFLEELREHNATVILNELSTHTRLAGKNILDIGCAAGWFLEVAKRYQLVATGLEPEVVVANKGISKGLDIKTVSFPDESLADREFDIISFNDVFEHILNPDNIIQHVYSHLKKNGFVIINLPSSNGFIYKISCLLARLGYKPLLERLWQKGYFSPHLYYYSPNNLTQFMVKYNFDLVSENRLDVIRIKGLWNRINHDKKINKFIAVVLYFLAILASPILNKLFPPDIIFCIYQKRD